MSTVGSADCAHRTPQCGVPTDSLGVQQLSWRCFAVGKNFSDRRRKVFDAGTWHDNAVAAAVSFLGDTQKPAALILPELDVEVLALDL